MPSDDTIGEGDDRCFKINMNSILINNFLFSVSTLSSPKPLEENMCLGEKSRLIMSVFVTLFLKDTRQRQKYSK